MAIGFFEIGKPFAGTCLELLKTSRLFFCGIGMRCTVYGMRRTFSTIARPFASYRIPLTAHRSILHTDPTKPINSPLNHFPRDSSKSQFHLKKFFSKTKAIFHILVLPVIGNDLIFIFLVKPNGFGLPFSSFQYTFIEGQFFGPSF